MAKRKRQPIEQPNKTRQTIKWPNEKQPDNKMAKRKTNRQ